jgi:hypothetical protein
MKSTVIKLNFNFQVRYSKTSQTPKVMKIRTVVADLFHEETDGQTEMAKLKPVPANFAKAPQCTRTNLNIKYAYKNMASDRICSRTFIRNKLSYTLK